MARAMRRRTPRRQTPVVELATRLGPLSLRTPLIAASGTVGSVVEMAGVADLTAYGAAVAKSVSPEPWGGPACPAGGTGRYRDAERNRHPEPGHRSMAHATIESDLSKLPVPVWGSAVGHTVEDFARVAEGLAAAGVEAIEINLSCPNLDGHLIALDPLLSAKVTAAVKSAVDLPVGAKLSPNAVDIASVAAGLCRCRGGLGGSDQHDLGGRDRHRDPPAAAFGSHRRVFGSSLEADRPALRHRGPPGPARPPDRRLRGSGVGGRCRRIPAGRGIGGRDSAPSTSPSPAPAAGSSGSSTRLCRRLGVARIEDLVGQADLN